MFFHFSHSLFFVQNSIFYMENEHKAPYPIKWQSMRRFEFSLLYCSIYADYDR